MVERSSERAVALKAIRGSICSPGDRIPFSHMDVHARAPMEDGGERPTAYSVVPTHEPAADDRRVALSNEIDNHMEICNG